jgi:arsenate reductase-like glutaredoxin family protein
MPKKIDWLYARKACVTCQKAKAYTDAAAVKVGEAVDANKTKIGPDEAYALLAAKGIAKIVAARGKSVVTLDLKKDAPEKDDVLARIIGPTGNLRAPTAVVGKTLLVGFSEETYADILGL